MSGGLAGLERAATRSRRWLALAGGWLLLAISIVTLTVPIFLPVVTALGFDPIWFGVVIVVVPDRPDRAASGAQCVRDRRHGA